MPDPKQTPSTAEEQRLRALWATGLLDSEPESAFDRFTVLAAKLLKAPVALLSLVDENRQFFKSAVGLPESVGFETALSYSICKHVVASGEPLVVSDARAHPELRSNRAVEEFGVVAYVGMPLIDAASNALGAFCVIDTKPRSWSRDEVGVLRELTAAIVDQIALRSAAKELQESEAFHRAVFDGVDVALLTFDLTRRVTWANSSAEWMFGYAPGELAGTRLFDLLDASDREIDRALHSELSDRERTRVTHERKMKRKDGSRIWVRRTLSLVPSSTHKSLVLASIEEIDGAKQLEEQLRHSDQRYRALVRSLPMCAVGAFDRDLRFVVAEGEELMAATGLSVSTVLGKTVRELASSSVNARRLEHVFRAALRGESTALEIQRGARWLKLHVAPLGEGGAQGGMLLIQDNTVPHNNAEALERQSALLRLLQRIASATCGAGSGSSTLRSCLEMLCRELRYPIGHVLVREGDALLSTGVWYVDDPLTRRPFISASAGLRLEYGVGLPGRALSEGRAIASPDISADPTFVRASAALASGLHAAFALPLRAGEQTVAVIECFSDRAHPEGNGLLDALDIVAALLGRAVERERLTARL